MILIHDGYMIDPKSGREGNYDILIDGDKIVKIAEKIEPRGKVTRINAEGLLVAPGLVDVHVHFRDPGFTAKEDINTGAAAAAKGGVTTVVLMANTKPTVDSEETLHYILDKGAKTGIHVTTCANVTMGMQGKQLTDMKKLAVAGAVGFTDDGVPLLDAELVRRAMEISAELDMPISFHEEDPKYIENNGVNRGKASEHYGIGGSAREAEIALVERDLKLAEETGACIDIQHISSKEAVELVRQAKKRCSNIHAEATPHHFTLTEDAVIKYGTLAKMNPPSAGGSGPSGGDPGTGGRHHRYDRYGSCPPYCGGKSKADHRGTQRHYRVGDVSGAGHYGTGGQRISDHEAAVASDEYQSGGYVPSGCRISGRGRPGGCDSDRYRSGVHSGEICVQGHEYTVYRMESEG